MMVLLFGIAAPASAETELSATEKGFPMGSSPGIQAARPMGSSPGDHAARPIAVLVMAVGRSGSSMVGQFFNQNKVGYQALVGSSRYLFCSWISYIWYVKQKLYVLYVVECFLEIFTFIIRFKRKETSRNGGDCRIGHKKKPGLLSCWVRVGVCTAKL